MNNQRLALATLSLTTLMASLDTSIANSGLPAMASALRTSFQGAQWIVLAYLLAVTSLILPAGRAADLFGRRRLLLTGTTIFTAASALCAFAPSIEWLVAARLIQGVGASLMMALTLSFAKENAPNGQSGSAIGLLGTMSAIGTALGPSLGGLLIAKAGWPAIFLINVPVGTMNLFFISRAFSTERPSETQDLRNFGLPGAAIFAAALAAYAASMTVGHGKWTSLNLGLLATAIALSVVFRVVDRRQSKPFVSAAVVKAPGILPGFLASTLVSTVIMSTIVVGPFYLSQALHLSPIATGLVLSVGPAVVAISGLPAGRLADKFGAQRVNKVGLYQLALGTLLLSLLPPLLGLAGYVPALAIATSGYALFQTSNNIVVMSEANESNRGLISGGLNLARNVGLVTGASVMGAIYAAFTGTAAPVDRVQSATTGLSATFLTATAIVSIAILVTRRTSRPSSEINWRTNLAEKPFRN